MLAGTEQFRQVSKLQWLTYINTIRGNLPALEVRHLCGRAVLYGDVAAGWQIGIQSCCGSRHKEGYAATTTPSLGESTSMMGSGGAAAARQKQHSQGLAC